MKPQAEIVPLDALLQDSENANAGTERGAYMLDYSLRNYGAGRSLLVDRKGKLIAGNKSQLAALDIGMTEAIIVPSDGTRLVVVQREDLDLDDPDDTRARQMAWMDNRASEVGLAWDVTQIIAAQEKGVDLSPMFRPDEIEALVERATSDIDTDTSNADTPFAEFSAMPTDDGYVAFKFGDYSGRVTRLVYDSFTEAYRARQKETNEVLLDDVLRSWLSV